MLGARGSGLCAKLPTLHSRSKTVSRNLLKFAKDVSTHTNHGYIVFRNLHSPQLASGFPHYNCVLEKECTGRQEMVFQTQHQWVQNFWTRHSKNYQTGSTVKSQTQLQSAIICYRIRNYFLPASPKARETSWPVRQNHFYLRIATFILGAKMERRWFIWKQPNGVLKWLQKPIGEKNWAQFLRQDFPWPVILGINLSTAAVEIWGPSIKS